MSGKSRKKFSSSRESVIDKGFDERKGLAVPSHEELSSIRNLLKCSQKNCHSVFKCSSNLDMHLSKHHNIAGGLRKASVNFQYACPVDNCKYGLKSSNYFSKRKYLKQHYLKCHAKREFTCSQCQKGFPTKSMQLAHEKSCGIQFVCTCGWKYSSRESLMTHCKRKKHIPAEMSSTESKHQSKKDISSTTSRPDSITNNNSAEFEASSTKVICSYELSKDSTRPKCESSCSNFSEDDSADDETNHCQMKDVSGNSVDENTVVKLCISSQSNSKPTRKPSNDVPVFPTHYIAAIALSELSTTFIIPKNCHIGVQTVDTKTVKKSRSPGNEKKRKSTQETQTSVMSNKLKRQKISAETQTMSHVKRKNAGRIILRRRRKSIETQTKDPMPFLSSVGNESLDGGMFNESSLSNSSMTQEEPRKKQEIHNNLDDDAAWDNQNFNRKREQESKSFVTTINSSMFNLNNELTIDARGGENSLSHFTNFDKHCNNETQTEIDALMQTDIEGTSTIETQTSDELFEDLIYSNMCTQTCDDVGELFDFDFVDIETQTAWPVL